MEFIKIESRSRWLLKDIPNYHPDDPRHTQLWREYKKKCIEGVWERDFEGYRFMPGNLWFYINFGIILDADKKKKSRYKIKPLLRDLEWERAYMCLEAFGFSGFTGDEYITCNHSVRDYLKTNDNSYLESLSKEEYKGDGTLKEYKHPREYLRGLHSQPLGKPLYHNNAKNTMELGCLHESVKVRMFDGSLKYSKDIEVGDLLMGVDSTPRTVKSLVRGKGIMYDIHTNYNESFRCTDSHLHQIRDIRNGKILTLDTNEYLDASKTNQKYFYEALKSEAIQYPKKELKLHPYFIGLWLGDGFKREKLICINEKSDKEIKDWLVNYANSEPRFSYTESLSKSGLTDSYTTRFRLIDNTMLYKGNYWSKTFLNNKHIPQEYLLSSIEQRLELLAGFIDSDGSYERGRYSICNVDLKLLEQTRELAQSLGFKAKIHKPSITGLTNSLKYNLRITGNISTIPCKVERKKATDTNKQGSKRNTIQIDLTSGKVEDFYGFEIDGDNLYLLENYLVTHNSRGGGKSYWYSLGVNLYEILFDGAKEYTEESRKKPATTEVLIGAAISSKSAEFCAKIKLAMEELGTNPSLGCWGKPGDEDYQPSPFYKDMAGSLEPNNAKNPYIHKYSKKINGRWVDGFGSGSKILHTTFTQENPEAGAGSRPVRITVEEVGLVPNVLTVHQSNDAAQNKDDFKFGTSHYLGTAGNIDKIIETRIIFTEPEGYDILSYDDEWEHTGKIGFFLPAYYTNNTFKDENGNTNVEKAKAFYDKRRESAKKVSSQKYDGEIMNYPLVPSEMFLGREGRILPITELKEVEKRLLLHNNYKKIGTAIDIFFDSSKPTGIDYRTLENTEPIYEFPTKRDANIEGCIMMYQAPIEVNGKVPNDLYDLVGFDPYVSENLGDGESLGSVYVMKNPKYSSMGYGGNEIVCGYTGKHALGRTRFLENVEKILMMYGSPNQGLWFEGNRGDYVKGYFEKKYKLHQLCLRPQIEKGVRILNRPVSEYGWITGNKISKIQYIDMLAEWMKEETIIDGISKRNLERLPDIALVRECIAFDLDKGNYDRIMALVGCIVGLREKVNQYEKQIINKNNPLSILANNDNLFNRHNHKLKKRKALLAQIN